jgi:hypothetical protein
MKKLLSFDEFVNEHYKIQEATDADGFNPQNTTGEDPTGPVLKSVSELLPGKEYVITVDGNVNTDMYYAGVTDGVHLFNGEDKANDVQMTDVEIADVIAKGGFVQVLEGASTEGKKNYRLNEGTLAAKGAKEFEEINLADAILSAEDDDWRNLYKKISETLGADPKDVIQVDSETNEDDPISEKIYTTLQNKFRQGPAVETPEFKISQGWGCYHDPKLNVINISDYGFEGYFFTAKSNF